ncbi:unnamed protein product [Durusdinium trenchii]|uniref:Structural maintenance of chromosomes protein n=1 Tax=Durusdinium trenchii TaxID=1381693 RepID=A0ABP0IHV0_9DINO
MGRVHEIIVENFKSYQGKVKIGPFRKFTCIIGPNGAGKSNLMDAISFVLGVQARQLRGERARDLVYCTEKEDPKKNQRTAYVELTYVDDQVESAGEQVLVFRRTITRTGEAKFQVNSATVSQADYQKRLESINILSKVRNFLVFQGDVEATAQRQGKELTAFFEQISGSDAFRQEYDRLATDKTKLEEQARYLFTKKRNAINERKRVSQQKDEADEYRQLKSVQQDLQREYFLFRLHGVSCQLEKSKNTREAAIEEKEAVKEQMESEKKNLEAADQARAKARLDTQQVEKQIVAVKAKLERLHPERVTVKSRLAFLANRLEELSDSAEKDGQRRSKLQEQLRAIREEEAKLESQQEELKKGLADRALVFTPDQLEEFDRVKRETEKATAASGDALRQLEHQLKVVRQERVQAEGDQRDATARQSHLNQRLQELNEAETAACAAMESSAALMDQRSQQLVQMHESLKSRSGEKEELQKERNSLLDFIQDFTATEQQLERERELGQICASLAEACPGVFGRVVDLCKPSQKRLHVAVNVAMAKFLDAIIVESSEAARACVRYLKERMLPPMTFLPMADLRVTDLDPRLQNLVQSQRGLRLGLNCVSFDEKYSRAFNFVLGDVVVADTMADGRRLAFGDSRKLGVTCKVVTLAGEAIAKNGNLSVNSEATQAGATRFDVSELEATKARMESIDRRMHQIHSQESAGGADVAALELDMRRVEGKAQEAAMRLQQCQEELRQKRAELQSVEATVAAVQPEAQRLALEEARLREEQRSIEARVSEAVAGHFAHLSAAMGVDDVRKMEREFRREKEAVDQQTAQLARRLRNVKAEISMLEQTLEERRTKDPKELEAKFSEEAAELRTKETKLAREAKSLEKKVSEQEQQLSRSHEAERDNDKVLSALRQQQKERRQQLMAAEKKVSDLGSEQQALLSNQSTILRQSLLEGIEVPLLRGGPEALQELAEETQPASAPTQRSPVDTSSILVDFSLLAEEKQAASHGAAAQMLEAEYKAELERLRAELERLSPNLKAVDQLQGVAENLQAASHEADAARKSIEEIEGKFETVRKARKEKFIECFQKVSAAIGPVYRRLTAQNGADGGSAYLDLEDAEDPFNGGIKFTAMPPAKRFRDMHLLSGGEKTLAAMALLFAVQAFQQPPFMVLDEVDAALDANNVRTLSKYVEQAGCQTIVISLKDRFFIRAEALVGVWKNKLQETSAILTLDLTRYIEHNAQFDAKRAWTELPLTTDLNLFAAPQAPLRSA